MAGAADLLRAWDRREGSVVSDEPPTEPRGVKASSNILSNVSHLNDARAFVLFEVDEVWVTMADLLDLGRSCRQPGREVRCERKREVYIEI